MISDRARSLWIECGAVTRQVRKACARLQSTLPMRRVGEAHEDVLAVLERIAAAQRYQRMDKPVAPNWEARSGRRLSAAEREIARVRGWA